MAYPLIDGLTGPWILLDGELLDPQSAQARICFALTDERMFYEVIRIEEKIPLFWEDHLLSPQSFDPGLFRNTFKPVSGQPCA